MSSRHPITNTRIDQVSICSSENTYHKTEAPKMSLMYPVTLIVFGELINDFAKYTNRRSKKTEAPTAIIDSAR